MVQAGCVFLQNHGWKDTKICDYCCRPAHQDHIGLWGPGNQLQDFWFCKHVRALFSLGNTIVNKYNTDFLLCSRGRSACSVPWCMVCLSSQ